MNSEINTTSVMTSAVSLNVCAASPESGGDDPSDYSSLEGNWTQQAPISFFPNVSLEKSRQLITVAGAMAGDQMYWTQAHSCSDIPSSATATSTKVYSFVGDPAAASNPTSNSASGSSSGSSSGSGLGSGSGSGSDLSLAAAMYNGTEDVLLHTGTTPGEWYVCYKPSGGLWSSLPTLVLTVRPLVTYSPLIGIAGSVTTITFTGGDSRDFVVLTASGNCSNAHLIQSGTDSFARVPIGDMVQTTTSMNATTELTFCYSAWQTGGDTDGDFVALDATFEQITPFTFGPLRIVTGAAQVINLNNISNGDQVKFVQSPNCSSSLMSSAATAEASAVYTLDASGTNQDIAMHTTAGNGTFFACYKPADGMWTHVLDRQFNVIPSPSFDMSVGMAGTPTEINFLNSQDNDFIVLAADCTDAQSVVDSAATRAKQNITLSSVTTTVSMTTSCDLKVCYGNAHNYCLLTSV